MRQSLLVLLITFLAVLGEAAPAQVPFTVQSTVIWQGTGVNVTAGQILRISASGIICHGTGCVTETDQHDPNGCCPFGSLGCGCVSVAPGDMPVPGVNAFSLVGKIGITTFFVGDQFIFTVPETGELFLAFNDNKYDDNSGQFDVVIYDSYGVPSLTYWGGAILIILLAATGIFIARKTRHSVSEIG